MNQEGAGEAPANTRRKRGFGIGTDEEARQEGYEVAAGTEGSEEPESPPTAVILPLNTPHVPAVAQEHQHHTSFDSTPPTGTFTDKLKARAVTLHPEIANIMLQQAEAERASEQARAVIEDAKKKLKPARKRKSYRGSRVTRQWLDSLPQRKLFVALGLNGNTLFALLAGSVDKGELKAWVDGESALPWHYRAIFTLEHLLDRRSQYTRSKLPDREDLQKTLDNLPLDAQVSKLLGGFDADGKVEGRYTRVALRTRQDEIEAKLRIVTPEDGNNLGRPLSPGNRRQRQLGVALTKPSSHCYQISKKTEQAGVSPMTPREVMELINRGAALERKYGVAYSVTRKDENAAWSSENLMLCPTSHLSQ